MLLLGRALLTRMIWYLYQYNFLLFIQHVSKIPKCQPQLHIMGPKTWLSPGMQMSLSLFKSYVIIQLFFRPGLVVGFEGILGTLASNGTWKKMKESCNYKQPMCKWKVVIVCTIQIFFGSCHEIVWINVNPLMFVAVKVWNSPSSWMVLVMALHLIKHELDSLSP